MIRFVVRVMALVTLASCAESPPEKSAQHAATVDQATAEENALDYLYELFISRGA